MSIQREVPRDQVVQGLKLKRRLGDKVRITHRDGDEIVLQVVRFESGWQVVIAFSDDEQNFSILREELSR